MGDQNATIVYWVKMTLPFFTCLLLSCDQKQQEESLTISNPIVQLNDDLFEGMNKVVVHQSPDAVYKKDVSYEAFPLSEVLIKAYPEWKELLQQDAVLIMRAIGGYVPQMPFSDGFSGRVYVATNIEGRGSDQAYDCWDEGGEEHCDLGYFLIWTDGFYPERPQPWGTYEFEVIPFETAYGDAIPQSSEMNVIAGFNKYRKYCIECHQINFVGGNKATEHIARKIPLEQNLLDHFLFNFRKLDPTTYMPDFNGILTPGDSKEIMAYIDHMQTHQNYCVSEPDDPRCEELRF